MTKTFITLKLILVLMLYFQLTLSISYPEQEKAWDIYLDKDITTHVTRSISNYEQDIYKLEVIDDSSTFPIKRNFRDGKNSYKLISYPALTTSPYTRLQKTSSNFSTANLDYFTPAVNVYAFIGALLPFPTTGTNSYVAYFNVFVGANQTFQVTIGKYKYDQFYPYNCVLQTYTSALGTIKLDFTINSSGIFSSNGINITLPKIYSLGIRSTTGYFELAGFTLSVKTNSSSSVQNKLSRTTSTNILKLSKFAAGLECSNYCKLCSIGNTCIACPSNSFNWQGVGVSCPIEFFDLGRLTKPVAGTAWDIELSVPAPTSWDFTIDFWYWIQDPTLFAANGNNDLKIVYKDYVSFAIANNSSTQALQNTIVYCVPLEYMNNIESNNNYSTKTWTTVQNKTFSGAFKWTYVKCGFSLSQQQMYLGVGSSNPTLTSFNLFRWSGRDNSSLNFKGHSKSFYRTSQRTQLRLYNFYNPSNEVYLRNLNVFNTLMPVGNDWRYYRIYKFTVGSLPLVFSIPFESSSSSSEVLTISIYDSALATTVVSLGTNTLTFTPSLNFRRLNFLDQNKKYTEDTLSVAPANFSLTSDEIKSDDSIIISCPTGQFYRPDNTCHASSCSANTFRNFVNSNSAQRLFCTNTCSNSTACPTSNSFTSSALASFTCDSNTYLKKDYQCITKSDPNALNTALQFSGTFNSAGIRINLGEALVEYTIDVWIHADNFILKNKTAIGTYFQNKRFFLTDAFSAQFDSTGTKFQFIAGGATYEKTEAPINAWMHLIIGINYGKQSFFTLYNNFKNPPVFNAISSMQNIYFCNKDYDVGAPTPICNQTWIDAYYSKLRVFKNTAYLSALIDDHSALAAQSLVTYFDLTLTSLAGNSFTSTSSINSGNQLVSIDYLNKYTNYDNQYLFNIGNEYSHDSITPNTYVDTITADNFNYLSATTFTCHTNCTKCFANTFTKCFSCNEANNFVLKDSICVNSLQQPKKYVYQHSSSHTSDLVFNFDSLTSSNTNNEATFFAFIKFIYIPLNAEKCLIEFSDSLCLHYDANSNFRLRYSVTTPIPATYDIFEVLAVDFNKYLGNWIPISVSTYKTTTASIKSMISMTIETTLLPYKLGSTIYDLLIERVVFKKEAWLGFASHVSFFKSFMINPYGYIKTKGSFNMDSETFFTFNALQGKTLSLRDDNPAQCIKATDYTSAPAGLTCVYDFNPYIDLQLVDSTNKDMLSVVNNEAVITSAPLCCTNSTNNCLRVSCDESNNVTTALTEANYLYDACDYKNTFTRRLVYHSTLANTIRCHEIKGINFNRYQEAKYNLTPDNTGLITINFNFRPEQYVSTDINANSIKFTINWTTYIKLVIEKKTRVNNGTPEVLYVASCNVLGSNRANVIAFKDLERAPVNLSCSFDYTNKKATISATTNIGVTPVLSESVEIYDFGMNNFTPSSQEIKFTDESTLNYGFSLVKNISIYSCYNCSSGTAYDVFPCLDTDGKMKSTSGQNTIVTFTDKVGYLGNLAYVITIGDLPPRLLCETVDQFEYLYFRPITIDCGKIYNLNLITNANGINFTNIPSSLTNARYTLAFWIYIDNINLLTDGFNVIYDKHMHIHIGNDVGKIATYCFPTGKTEAPILNLTTSQINTYITTTKDPNSKVSSYDGQSAWSLQTCTVNVPQGKYYINNDSIKYLTPNFTATSLNTNIAHLRNFNNNTTATVSLYLNQLYSANNLGRVFFKQISILQDYIPKEMYDNLFYFKSIYSFFDTNNVLAQYSTLAVFNTDIGESLTYTVGSNSATLKYKIASSSPVLTGLNVVAIATSALRYSKSSSVNAFELCDHDKEKDSTGILTRDYKNLAGSLCVQIDGSCTSATTHCMRKNPITNAIQYYFCESGSILNLTTLSCESGTINQFTPNSRIAHFNYSEYSADSNGACTNTTTMKNFYHQCIDNSTYTNMYFSYNYSFSDIITPIPIGTITSNEYAIEVWFYVDIPPKVASGEVYYFISHPHTFSTTGLTTNYTNGTTLSLKYNASTVIGNLNVREWNNLYIKANSSPSNVTFAHLNYNPTGVQITDGIPLGVIFCNLSPTCTVLGINYTTIQWGNAWYKYIKVYKVGYSVDILRQLNGLTDTENTFAFMMLYFDFSITRLNKLNSLSYEIKDYLANLTVNTLSAINNNRPINFTTKFDYVDINSKQNFYINDKAVTTIVDASLSACNDTNCNRCFNGNANNCYECKTDYLLSSTLTCNKASGYFFKSSTSTDIELNLNGKSLSNQNKITVAFFFKIYASAIFNSNFYQMVLLNVNPTYKHEINYSMLRQLEVKFNSKRAVLISNSGSIQVQERWNYIAISIYRTQNDSKVPHNISVQFNRDIQPFVVGFDKSTESVTFDKFTISKEVISLYADISIYSSFIKGPFGLFKSTDSVLKNTFRMLHYQLVQAITSNSTTIFDPSKNTNKCIEAGQISSGNINTVSCAIDYDKVFDTAFNCSAIDKTLVGDACTACSSNCTASANTTPKTSCHANNNNSSDCSCFIHRSSYLLSNTNQCRESDSLNIGYMQDISLSVKGSKNKEMTMEFWALSHSYKSNNFNEINLIWDKHLRMKIMSVDSSTLNAKGYALADANDQSIYDSYTNTMMTTSNANKSEWHFYRISSMFNEYGLNYYVNRDLEATSVQVTTNFLSTYVNTFKVTNDYNVNLKIYMQNNDPNYGIAYIRELRIYDSFLYSFYDTRYILLDSSFGLQFFQHHFKLSNNLWDDSTDADYNTIATNNRIIQIADLIKSTNTNATSRGISGIYGYSEIPSTVFDKLLQCNTGQIYDLGSQNCITKPAQTNCDSYYGADDAAVNRCIKCPVAKPFLHLDNKCYDVCPDSFSGFAYNGFCRKCHSNCKTCNGLEENSCLTCATGRFSILETAIAGLCVDRCEDYERIADIVTNPLIPYCIKCTTGKCNNYNEYSNIEFNVPTSGTIDKYSIGAWVFIENITNFTSGFSIFYDEHIGFFINKGTGNSINSVCFPQEYKTQLNGKTNYTTEILPMMDVGSNKVLNSKTYNIAYSTSTGQWSYLFCSASLQKGEYYHNNSAVTQLKPYDSNNKLVYRDLYTALPRLSSYKLHIQNTNAGTSRIFINNITILNDYIPQEIFKNNLFYKDIRLYSIPLIIFSAQMPVLAVNPPRLTYLNTSSASTTVNLTLGSKTYSSSSAVIDPKICDIKSKFVSPDFNKMINDKTSQCSVVTSCTDTSYCLETDAKKFYCSAGNYLDISNLACVTTSVSSKTKEPNGSLYMTLDCNSRGFTTCPAPSYSSNTGITCSSSSNSLLFYDCINTSKRNSNISGLYFSSVFSFKHINIDISKIPTTVTALNEYYIEFWMLIDNSAFANSKSNALLKNTDKFYYFYAKPHSIFATNSSPSTTNTLSFTYNSGTTDYPMSKAKNLNEWIITYISVTKSTSINYLVKVFTNFDFTNPEVSFESPTALTLDKLIFCPHFNDDMTCATTYEGKSKKWGFANYKNIKIWDNAYFSSPRLIQDASLIGDKTNSLLYYWFDFYLNKVNLDSGIYKVKEIKSDSFVINYPSTNNDHYDLTFNYSLEYDKIVKNNDYSKYISTNVDGALSLLGSPTNCKRSFDSVTCYECNDGFLLAGNSCYQKKSYYLQTPDKGSNILELITDNISSFEKITITFFVKIISNTPSADSTKVKHPLMYLNSDKLSYISYERQTTEPKPTLALVINNTEAYKYSYDYQNKWAHIGFSLLKKGDSDIFPQQMLFQIEKVLNDINASFNLQQVININYIGLNHEVYALYSDLRIYNTFIVGTYGISKSKDLSKVLNTIFYSYPLSSTEEDKCKSVILSNSNVVTADKINCVAEDYFDYLNSNVTCDNNNLFMNYDRNSALNTANYSCLSCDKACLIDFIPGYLNTSDTKKHIIDSSCNSSDNTQCSCMINMFSFYQYNKSCRYAKSLNFANLEKEIELNVRESTNNEMTIEFWFHIGFYIKNKLSSIELLWNGHMSIKIEQTTDSLLSMQMSCMPYAQKVNDKITYYSETEKIITGFEPKKWFLVRCSVNRNLTQEKYYIFDNTKKNTEAKILTNYAKTNYSEFIKQNYVNIDKDIFNDKFKYVKLYISNNYISSDANQVYNNENFGYVYIRELKLFTTYLTPDFQTWNTKISNKKYNDVKFLLHYFENTNMIFDDPTNIDLKNNYTPVFYGTDLIDQSSKNNRDNRIRMNTRPKSTIKGYNKVNYELDNGLVICNEDEIILYDGTCKKNTSNCRIAASDKKCILCGETDKYSHVGSQCFSKCPDAFFGDDTILMCRNCNAHCGTCSGPLNSQCLSCGKDRYLFKEKKDQVEITCIEQCAINKLINYPFTKESSENRECTTGVLEADVTISNFDPTIPQNPFKLSYINFHVKDVRLKAQSIYDNSIKTEYKVIDDYNVTYLFNYAKNITITNSTDQLEKDLNITLIEDSLEKGKSYSILINVQYTQTSIIGLDSVTNLNKTESIPIAFTKLFKISMSTKPKGANMVVNPKEGLANKIEFHLQCLTDTQPNYSVSNQKISQPPLSYRLSYKLISEDKEVVEPMTLEFPKNDNLIEGENIIYLSNSSSDYTFKNNRLVTLPMGPNSKDYSVYKVYCMMKDNQLDGSLTKFSMNIIVSEYTSRTYHSSFDAIYNDKEKTFLLGDSKSNLVMLSSFFSKYYGTCNSNISVDNISESCSGIDLSKIQSSSNIYELNCPSCDKCNCNNRGSCVYNVFKKSIDCICKESNDVMIENQTANSNYVDRGSQILQKSPNCQAYEFDKVFTVVLELIESIPNDLIKNPSNWNSTTAAIVQSASLLNLILVVDRNTTALIDTLEDTYVDFFKNYTTVINKNNSFNIFNDFFNLQNSLSSIGIKTIQQYQATGVESGIVKSSMTETNVDFTNSTLLDEAKANTTNTENSNKITNSSIIKDTDSSSTSTNSINSINSSNTKSKLVVDTKTNNRRLLLEELDNKFQQYFDKRKSQIRSFVMLLLKNADITIFTYDSSKENLSVSSDTNNKVLNNIIVTIAKLANVQNIDTLLKETSIANNYPYVGIENCIRSTGLNRNNLGLLIIHYKISPYIYNEYLSNSSVSTLLTVELLDISSGNKISITNCGSSDDKQISLMFPVYQFSIPQLNTNWKDLLKNNNQLQITDNYFKQPFYIESSGKVLNLTIQERLLVSYLPVNFTCNYVDEAFYTLKNNGIKYTNFTSNDYFECQTNHLTDFTLNYGLNPSDIQVLSKFYYLNKFELYIYKDNYKNASFYICLLIFSINILFVILNILFKSKKFDIKNVKLALIENIIPYLKKKDFIELTEGYKPQATPKAAIDHNSNNQANINPLCEVNELNQNSIRNVESKENNTIQNKLQDNGNGNENGNNLILNNNNTPLRGSSSISIPINSSEYNSEFYSPIRPQKPITNNNIEEISLHGVDNSPYRKLSIGIKETNQQHDNFLKRELNNKSNLKSAKASVLDNISAITGRPINTISLPIIDEKQSFSQSAIFLKENSQFSALSYFLFNIKTRHFILGDLFSMPLSNKRKLRKILLISINLLLSLLIPVLIFLSNGNIKITNVKDDMTDILKSIILTLFVTNVFSLLYSALLSINRQNVIRMFNFIKEANDIKLMNSYKNHSKSTIKDFIIIGVFICLFIATFHLCYGFCAVYSYQQVSLLISFSLSFILDMLILEFVIEVVLALLYSIRAKGKIILYIFNFLERIRNSRKKF